MRSSLLILLCCSWLAPAYAAPGGVLVVPFEGAIGPASADFVHRSLERAAREKAQLLVLRIDTPGGLDTSMRAIIKDILASPVPVAGYVAPDGVRAASAGTFILYATPIAAMAPATNLGAASLVAIGAPQGGPPGKADDAKKSDKDAGAVPADTLMRKQMHAAAYTRSLAQPRGRNADWVERAVREAVSLAAEDALKLNVIDVVAQDLPALLTRLDGRVVEAGRVKRTLRAKDVVVAEVLSPHGLKPSTVSQSPCCSV